MPNNITIPKSAPKVAPAAAMPGCGGTKQCTPYKEVAKHMVIRGIPKLVRRTSDCFNPLRMMKPESQKMGKPTKNPVMESAAGARFSPTFPRM